MEEQFEVPYRYYKDFSGDVTTKGETRQETWQMFVRDLKNSIHNDFTAFGRRIETDGLCRQVTTSLPGLKCFEMRPLFEYAYTALERDPQCLLAL